MGWPVVLAFGKPGDRGRAYGAQAAERVRRSVQLYARVFERYAGLSWDEVRERARAFTEPIDRYDPAALPELEGIAEGAGLHPDDLLALNVRTEVMFGMGLPPRECTAVVALPDATTDGHTIVAQNWDWKPETRETCVLLACAPDDGPAFATVVEAGLLAKTGMNEAGIGLATNALVSDRDRGEPGVPYHLILRRILQATSFAEAANAVFRPERASSANYLIAHRDGEALDLEAAPGRAAETCLLWPERGVLAHANHFQSTRFLFQDAGLADDGADSLVRQHRAERAMHEGAGGLSVPAVQDALRDHFDHPSSVCSHPKPGTDAVEDYATIASVVMDLTEHVMWVTEGPPCEGAYERYDAAELFAAARASD
ncbi:MAG: C45 family autoproteolytic acyltransferase/hydrolase [Candidatus Velamenicoccus archaeovorus]